MPVYHVKCYETVEFTVAIEAESPQEAEELALADINSHEVIAESKPIGILTKLYLNQRSGILMIV